MMEHVRNFRPDRMLTGFWRRRDDESVSLLARRRVLGAALIACLLSTFYWMVIASDRYVSEARVIVERTDLPGGQAVDLAGLLAGGGNGSRADQLLVRDYLLSADLLRKLDAELGLRAHYSDPWRDPLSRMWFQRAPFERFHRYFLSRVSVDYDDYAGVLVIKAQAYDAQTARAIAAMMVSEGEQFLNSSAHKLAKAQVAFLEEQLDRVHQRNMKARQALLDFQDRKGLVSPLNTAEGIGIIITRLEAQRAETQAQVAALRAYLVPDHPNIAMLEQQAAALTEQIEREHERLAAPGGRSLNRTTEEFQRLEFEAGFTQEVYKSTLASLERGRLEATRTIKKLSVVQAPTLPESASQPRRTYNSILFFLLTMLLAGVAHLLAAIVRDHMD